MKNVLNKFESLPIPNFNLSKKIEVTATKTNFSTFLQLSCSKFRLKLCERPKSYLNCEAN